MEDVMEQLSEDDNPRIVDEHVFKMDIYITI